MVVRVRLGTPIKIFLEWTRKGGTENGLVDLFPDAARRVRLGTPIKFKEKIKMKKDKIKYNCFTGIILIIFNICMKFLIYGKTAIWLDYMPMLPEGTLPPEIEIFKRSMYRMIPFLIVNACITIIYIRKMYDKKIYNKKTDVLFPIIIFVVNLILVYFLISINHKVVF